MSSPSQAESAKGVDPLRDSDDESPGIVLVSTHVVNVRIPPSDEAADASGRQEVSENQEEVSETMAKEINPKEVSKKPDEVSEMKA